MATICVLSLGLTSELSGHSSLLASVSPRREYESLPNQVTV